MAEISLPYFDDFLLYLKTQNYSQETIYNYERDLKVFQVFINDSSLPFKKVDKKSIAQYKAYLISRDRQTAVNQEQAEKRLSAASINRMLSSLRSYLRWLIEMDYKAPIIPDSVKLIKTSKKKSKVPELEDLIRLIEAPTTLEQDKRIGLRNRAILEVLFSTGMRISELCRLNREDIDQTGRIFIIGKGRKERFVYLTPRAKQHLERYLVSRDDSCPALFIPYSGPNVALKSKRISSNYIQAKIKDYRQKLKINIPISPHSLRHGFATYLAEEGASPAAIQILLGHESLDTTTRYVHASDRFAQQSHQKYHPLAKQSKK